MHQIRGSAGPSPISDTATQHTDGQTATVQFGESKLSDVAKRLNIDPNALQQANPNISDSLKVGQQLSLPQGPAAQAHRDDDDETVDNQPSSDMPPTPLSDPMAKSFMQAKLDASGKEKQTGELHASDLPQTAGGDVSGIANAKSGGHIPGTLKWEDTNLKKAVIDMKESDHRKDKWGASEVADKDAKLAQVSGGDYPSMAEKGKDIKFQKSGPVPNEFQKIKSDELGLKKVDVGETSGKPLGYDLVKDKPA